MSHTSKLGDNCTTSTGLLVYIEYQLVYMENQLVYIGNGLLCLQWSAVGAFNPFANG